MASSEDSVVDSLDKVQTRVFGKFNCNKAGMEGLDRETIDRIITENSKGSKFYENELRKEEVLRGQIAEKTQLLDALTPDQKAKGELEADTLLTRFLQERSFDRIIVHVDMDAFYAAVEMRDNPELRLIPMAVGGNNMLSTSNYLARRFGVRAAMPGFIGRKLCPELRIVAPDFAKYGDASRAVRSVLQLYSSPDRPMLTASLDEAYLDFTDHMTKRPSLSADQRTFWPRSAPKTPNFVCKCKSTNSPLPKDPQLDTCQTCGMMTQPGKRVFGLSLEEAVKEMRFRVFCATKLTCSAGIAANSLLAKIASDMKKPNGQFLIPVTCEAIESFIGSLPIRKIPGIGHVSERKLNAFGVNTCHDLFLLRGSLFHLFTRSAFAYYMKISLGYTEDDFADECGDDGSPNKSELNRKSMSVERTFRASDDLTLLETWIRELSESLVADLADAHIRGKTVTLKMKLDNFEIRQRSRTLMEHTDNQSLIFASSMELLREELRQQPDLKFRLLGLKMSNLMRTNLLASRPTIENFFSRKRLFSSQPEQAPCSVPASSSPSPKKARNAEIFVCPVCIQEIEAEDELQFNTHLDLCLNQSTLADLAQQEPDTLSTTSATPSSPMTAKTQPKPGSKSPAKQSAAAKKLLQKNTLDSFILRFK